MNLLKRAGLYTLRSRGRTLLLFAVLLLAATFVLSGLSAMEASENTSAKLRGTTGASFTVERNLSTGSMNSMGGGMSVIQQEFVTDAMLDEIRKVEGIKGYTAKEIGYYNLTDLSGNPHVVPGIVVNPQAAACDADPAGLGLQPDFLFLEADDSAAVFQIDRFPSRNGHHRLSRQDIPGNPQECRPAVFPVSRHGPLPDRPVFHQYMPGQPVLFPRNSGLKTQKSPARGRGLSLFP